MYYARSLVAGAVAAVAFLCVDYAGLGLVPATDAGFHDYHPLAAWSDRFDLSQFAGVFLSPPWPTRFTWELGFAAVVAGLAASAIVYVWLLSWATVRGSIKTGTAFGLALFLGLGVVVWLAPGFHPGVMRGALPDVGFYFLGWSSLAALHVLLCSMVYGGVLGYLTGRRQPGPPRPFRSFLATATPPTKLGGA